VTRLLFAGETSFPPPALVAIRAPASPMKKTNKKDIIKAYTIFCFFGIIHLLVIFPELTPSPRMLPG
jgi:hypothetical protein